MECGGPLEEPPDEDVSVTLYPAAGNFTRDALDFVRATSPAERTALKPRGGQGSGIVPSAEQTDRDWAWGCSERSGVLGWARVTLEPSQDAPLRGAAP